MRAAHVGHLAVNSDPGPAMHGKSSTFPPLPLPLVMTKENSAMPTVSSEAECGLF